MKNLKNNVNLKNTLFKLNLNNFKSHKNKEIKITHSLYINIYIILFKFTRQSSYSMKILNTPPKFSKKNAKIIQILQIDSFKYLEIANCFLFFIF